VGDVAYLSMPGEPFPEVRLAIARATPGATVVALSKGQDDFGYFYPAFDYPFPELYNSDHAVFNVAPQAGDQIIPGQLANLAAVGFPTSQGLEQPLGNSYSQKLKPGLQTLASPPTGDAGPSGRFATTLQAIYMPASVADRPLAGQVHWDFGDGTHGTSGYLSVGQDYGQTGQGGHGASLVTHAYGPGNYRVTADGADTAGNPVRWTLVVRVFPRLRLTVLCGHRRRIVRVRGGEGSLLRERWTRAGPRARISVLDAAGGTASAIARCR
jgi:hypothetical protein